jgi:serine/threonine-protein kinase RsbW
VYASRKSKGMQNSKTAIFKTSNAPIFNLKNSLQVLEHLLVYFIMTFSENKIAECIIRSKIGLETLVSSAFTSILSMKIQDAGKIAQIRIAIHEACINAMEHGNGFDANKMITCEIFEEPNMLSIHIHDEGNKSYLPDPSNLPTKEEMQQKIEKAGRRNKQNRGMGRFLIHYFADEVEYLVSPSKGTCIVLKTYIDE